MSEEKNSPGKEHATRVLVITRVFDAPRELVFKTWTDPEHVAKWFGPGAFTVPFCTIDLRVGGTFLYCMRSPEGQNFWGRGVYREIVEPERLVYIDTFADEKGNPVPASHYGMGDDWPTELLVTVTFEEHEGKTKLTLQHAGIPVGTEGDMAESGWNETLNKLAEYVTKL